MVRSVRRRLAARPLVGALVALPLIVFVVLPLGLLLVRSFAGGAGVYVDAWTSPTNRAALLNTVIAGGGAAVLALLAGLPLGAALARLPVRGGRFLGGLLVLPVAVPPYVWALAWITLGSPRAGWINRAAAALGADGPVLDIFGMGGIVWVLGLSLSPLVLLPVRAALEAADPALEEAARISGAGPLRAFATGSLPGALPAAVGGALLAFLAAISAFGVPYLLGVATDEPALVATTRIYQALALGAEADVRSAIALCVLLLVLAAVATAAATRVARARPPAAGKGRRPAPIAAPGLARAATVLAWSWAGVTVLLPTVAIVLAALTRRFGDPPGPGNLTLSQFADVLGKAETQRALFNSGLLAVGAATAIVAVGTAIAFLAPRTRGARTPLAVSGLARLAEAPYAIPGSVLALALLFAFSQELRLIVLDRVTFAFHAAGTLWILGIAYVVKYLAFGVRNVETALRSTDPSLEEAARVSGAGPGRAFLDVSLPSIRPALAAAWLLAFLPAATELTMSVLLAGPRTPVLGTVLFELSSYGDPPAAAVLACVCLVLVAVAQFALGRLTALAGGMR